MRATTHRSSPPSSSPNGTLTSQAVFVGRAAQGPGAVTAAITGGTGVTGVPRVSPGGVFIPGSDSVRVTVRLD